MSKEDYDDDFDLSGICISLCREMLKNYLGIEAAFFDDCVMLAVIETINARAEAWAIVRDAEM